MVGRQRGLRHKLTQRTKPDTQSTRSTRFFVGDVVDDLSGETSLMPYSTQLLHSMLWGLFFGMEIFTYVGNASNQRTVCQTAIQSCCWKGRSPLSNESRLHVLKGGRRERWGGGQCLFVHRHRQRQSAAVAKRLRPPPLTSKHAEEMGSRSSVSTPAGGGAWVTALRTAARRPGGGRRPRAAR